MEDRQIEELIATQIGAAEARVHQFIQEAIGQLRDEILTQVAGLATLGEELKRSIEELDSTDLDQRLEARILALEDVHTGTPDPHRPPDRRHIDPEAERKRRQIEGLLRRMEAPAFRDDTEASYRIRERILRIDSSYVFE